MTIRDELLADQKKAMKAKDKATLNAVRSIQSAVATAKSAPGFEGDVDDDLYTATITSYVKKITKARDEYESLGDRGAHQAATLAYEIDYLSKFLPDTLDEAETMALIERVVDEIGADESTPPGRIIGAVMKSGKDVDGALVARLVNERTSGNP